MTAFPLATLGTLLCLLVYAGLTTVVSRARYKYGVVAPAVTGNLEFEKRYRVQMNTIEQMPFLLPLLWLTAAWVGDLWAAIAAVVWSVGRVIYARAYYREAESRELGYTISTIPLIAMLLAVPVFMAIRWA